jgi:hypothetical protein
MVDGGSALANGNTDGRGDAKGEEEEEDDMDMDEDDEDGEFNSALSSLSCVIELSEAERSFFPLAYRYARSIAQLLVRTRARVRSMHDLFLLGSHYISRIRSTMVQSDCRRLGIKM